MKRCPTCQRTYPDDSPGFCVNDGAVLVTEEAQSYDPQKTMLASAPPPPPQYSNPQPPPAVQAPPQAMWPPPPPQQQGQNWGGGYYQQPGQPYGAPPYAPPVAGSKGLSLAALIVGIPSFIGVVIIFLMFQRIIDFDRDVLEICFWGSSALGAIAIVLGTIALISRRQRNKGMAIVGLTLGIPAVLFFIYALLNRI